MMELNFIQEIIIILLYLLILYFIDKKIKFKEKISLLIRNKPIYKIIIIIGVIITTLGGRNKNDLISLIYFLGLLFICFIGFGYPNNKNRNS